MTRTARLPAPVAESLVNRRPFLWLNPEWRPLQEASAGLDLRLDDIRDAETRWQRFASLLQKLFPELEESGGIIESSLQQANGLRAALVGNETRCGRWFIKCDHALPVAGSIKARGS